MAILAMMCSLSVHWVRSHNAPPGLSEAEIQRGGASYYFRVVFDIYSPIIRLPMLRVGGIMYP
jgi:hypothetical protein